jgi:hypothetical protein
MATAQADADNAAAPLDRLLVGWLTERGGPQKPSPAELGTTGLAPLADAPGTYIFELRFH